MPGPRNKTTGALDEVQFSDPPDSLRKIMQLEKDVAAAEAFRQGEKIKLTKAVGKILYREYPDEFPEFETKFGRLVHPDGKRWPAPEVEAELQAVKKRAYAKKADRRRRRVEQRLAKRPEKPRHDSKFDNRAGICDTMAIDTDVEQVPLRRSRRLARRSPDMDHLTRLAAQRRKRAIQNEVGVKVASALNEGASRTTTLAMRAKVKDFGAAPIPGEMQVVDDLTNHIRGLGLGKQRA
ncbi:MAG: hypothetical protein MMC23_000114 [Stictis urceolatum]|nr:hypothetical protein [Stictis urceolata]